jgi:hypothetical protein
MSNRDGLIARELEMYRRRRAPTVGWEGVDADTVRTAVDARVYPGNVEPFFLLHVIGTDMPLQNAHWYFLGIVSAFCALGWVSQRLLDKPCAGDGMRPNKGRGDEKSGKVGGNADVYTWKKFHTRPL